MTDQKLVVVKHNDLIRAAQQLSVTEGRIILACVAQVNSMAPLTMQDKITLYVSDLAAMLPEVVNIYSDIKESVERLANRWVYLKQDDRAKETKTRWLHTVSYAETEGRIDLYFSPFITPFLSELSRDFTQYKLEHVIHFKSSYSTGFYEWLKSYMTSEVVLTIEEIKEHFLLDDLYARQDKLQDKVIKPAIEDINKHSDMTVSYVVVKQGRRVTGFKFTYVCLENKKVTKPKFLPKEKAPAVKTAKASVDNLTHFTSLRKNFGTKFDDTIPAEIVAEMKEKGLW